MAEATRAPGRLAACSLHVAPPGNAIGALYNARFSGSPLIVTPASRSRATDCSSRCSTPAAQMAQPLVKWAVEATRAEDLPRIVRRAAKWLDPADRSVFISLPAMCSSPRSISIWQADQVDARVWPADEALEQPAAKLLNARHPVIRRAGIVDP
jgi:benzoylformate decarboxylase